MRDKEIQWRNVCGAMLNSEATRTVIDISEFVRDKLWPELDENVGSVVAYTSKLEENPQEIASKLTP